jgi:hypothetical protein
MRNLAHRVADFLRGENTCPECGSAGVSESTWEKVGGPRARHCSRKSCDVRIYLDGVVITSGYLTGVKREGPGT